jgi:crotonobetainyl-CoA:carnitine CoA-transferase CaiB-like acyl-CoA transferase
VLAGPLSAQMLADLGAEVIKIERGGGDDARAFGPPYLVDPQGRENNNNSFYLCQSQQEVGHRQYRNRRKAQIIRELARSCDVMMENYKVGDLKRYKLDYEAIKAVNPASSIAR